VGFRIMNVDISPMEEKDRLSLREILRNSFDTLSTLDTLELDGYIDGQYEPCRWYVARSPQRQVIGCINASTRSHEGYINSLSVRGEFRGYRIGTMLVQKAVSWLKSLDCKSVFLYVRINNEGAKVFYEKMGFVNHGVTKSQTLEDVLLLRKKI